MEDFISYPTVDYFLTGNKMPGTSVEVVGLVRTSVRDDTQNNGLFYLVGPGNYVRLYLDDAKLHSEFRDVAERGMPVSVRGISTGSGEYYDIIVSGVIELPVPYNESFLYNAILAILQQRERGRGPHPNFLEQLERIAATAALNVTRGRQDKAAELLGISPRVISYMVNHKMPDIGAKLKKKP